MVVLLVLRVLLPLQWGLFIQTWLLQCGCCHAGIAQASFPTTYTHVDCAFESKDPDIPNHGIDKVCLFVTLPFTLL
jgi:hypothetical protein